MEPIVTPEAFIPQPDTDTYPDSDFPDDGAREPIAHEETGVFIRRFRDSFMGVVDAAGVGIIRGGPPKRGHYWIVEAMAVLASAAGTTSARVFVGGLGDEDFVGNFGAVPVLGSNVFQSRIWVPDRADFLVDCRNPAAGTIYRANLQIALFRIELGERELRDRWAVTPPTDQSG